GATGAPEGTWAPRGREPEHQITDSPEGQFSGDPELDQTRQPVPAAPASDGRATREELSSGYLTYAVSQPVLVFTLQSAEQHAYLAPPLVLRYSSETRHDEAREPSWVSVWYQSC